MGISEQFQIIKSLALDTFIPNVFILPGGSSRQLLGGETGQGQVLAAQKGAEGTVLGSPSSDAFDSQGLV